MEELFSVYLRSGIFGSVIILLVLVLRLFLRKAPRRMLCLLWLLAAVRLLLPFHLESQFSLQPQYEPAFIAIDVSEDPVHAEPLPEVTPQEPNSEMIPGPTVENMQGTQDAKERPNTMQILSIVWLGVTGALFLYFLISYTVLRLRVKDAVKIDDGIMESDRIQGAFLLGYFRTKIYIPVGVSPQDRQFIIIHEQVHITRGDNWWKLLGFLCGCIHWYNPLVWLGYSLLCRDIEIACDEQVIRNMELEERKAYSYALLNCGKRISGLLACPVAFGEVSLKQRIKKVLSYRRPGQWITLVAVVLVLFIAICFLTTPKADAVDIPEETRPSATEGTQAHSAATDPQAPTDPQIPTDPQVPTDPTSLNATEEPTVPSQTHAAVPTETPATELPEVTVTEPTMEAPIPSESTPETVPDNESTTDKTIIASGKWDGGPVRWSVTSDGTLTISGNRSIQGVATHQTYIWKQYSDIITRIVVEDGITSIPQKAFSEMPNVTSIYLSRTLEKIEPEAFYKCTALEAVTIPAQVTEIPEYAFYGCSNLRELRFASDSRIHTIGQYAFSGTGITEFSSPPSLYEILSDAFSDCRLLQTVILKGGIEQVYYNAFRDCTRLKHIVLGESITNGGRPFGGCSAIETIEVYSEASVCFEEYTALKSITFKENARTICSSGFRGCTALSEVNLDAPIVTIESHAFFDCRSLTSIKLPNTVRNIEIYAFAYTGITRIVIPESVICMKGNVFIGSGLKEIVFQGDIPDFENNTFNGVTATVYYPADNITWMEEKLKDYGGNLTWIPQ